VYNLSVASTFALVTLSRGVYQGEGSSRSSLFAHSSRCERSCFSCRAKRVDLPERIRPPYSENVLCATNNFDTSPVCLRDTVRRPAQICPIGCQGIRHVSSVGCSLRASGFDFFVRGRRKAGMTPGCKFYRGVRRKVSGSLSARGHFSCCQVDQLRHPPAFLYIFSIFHGFVVPARISRSFHLNSARIRRDR